MNVALYLRYSSDKQTEQSIEGQQRVCEDFCRQNGYTIVATYVDRATSAFKDTEKRLQFGKMIKDSEKQLWQAVVVYKLDRFARNRYDSATYKAKLKKNGVRVISATENISDNPEGVILEAVLEGMAEFYSLELAQKINRGMHENALKCISTGGCIPLGYKIANKQYKIDEAAAPAVREAFSMYVAGVSVPLICKTLNDKGYRTSKHCPFKETSFKAMMRNEKYIGVYKYKDVRIENGIPAIIDKATFEAAQIRLEKNRRAPGTFKAKVQYLLSGKLFCGHCDTRMVAEGGKKGEKSYYYYSCGKRKHDQACNKKPLPKDWIERVVAEKTMEQLTPELIDQIAEETVRINREEIAANTLIPSIEAEIEDCGKRIANLSKALEAGVESETIITRIAELEKQRKDAHSRLALAQSEIVVLEKDHIVWFFSQFLGGDVDDLEFRRRLIDLLVNSVYVWDEPDDNYKITINWNTTDRPQDTFKMSECPEPCSTIESIFGKVWTRTFIKRQTV